MLSASVKAFNGGPIPSSLHFMSRSHLNELSATVLKRNELAFQNKKYAKTDLEPEKHKTSIEEFERSFLHPIHQGGKHPAGLLFSRAIQELWKNPIQGRRVLDYCCGRGDLGVYLAMKGAIVYGFDFSEKAIEIARFKARVNNVNVAFEVMDAAHLLYPDDYFDFVIGFEALHHVILQPGIGSELARVVRRGREMIFAENWGGSNPFFQLWRYCTTLRKNESASRGEVILHKAILDQFLGGTFDKIQVEPLSLFYIGKKYLRNQTLLKTFLQIDDVTMRMVPFLKQYCGEAVIKLIR